MNNKLELFNNLDGFNINPIPLEIGQELTTTKWLMSIVSKINQVITFTNNWYDEILKDFDGDGKLYNLILDKIIKFYDDSMKEILQNINDLKDRISIEQVETLPDDFKNNVLYIIGNLEECILKFNGNNIYPRTVSNNVLCNDTFLNEVLEQLNNTDSALNNEIQKILNYNTTNDTNINNLAEKITSAENNINSLITSINVKMFGAKGDGETDDTECIKKALKSAIDKKLSLYFPNGIYIVSSIFYDSLTEDKQINIIGENKKYTILKKNNLNTNPLLQIDVTTDMSYTANILIENITFDGNGNNAVCLNNVVRSTIQNCQFINSDVGLTLNGGIANSFIKCNFLNNNYGIYIDGYKKGSIFGYPNLTHFQDCIISDNASFGLFFDKGRMLTLDGCDIENNGTNDDLTTGGVHIGLNAGIENNDNTLVSPTLLVNNTWFEQNHGIASIFLESGKNIITTSYFVANHNAKYDIYVKGGNYILDNLHCDTRKEYNIFEEDKDTIKSGNEIKSCRFYSANYNTMKTYVFTPQGRLISRNGETPYIYGMNKPFIQQGKVQGSASENTHVTFDIAYSDTPFIQATLSSDVSGTVESIEVFNVTNSGFDFKINKIIVNASNNLPTISQSESWINWFAIGQYK